MKTFLSKADHVPAAPTSPPNRVIIFSGHMMDAPGRPRPRYPRATDTDDVKLVDDLPRFMKTLSPDDRVFVILSESYLKSENCMFEFYQMWIHSLLDTAEFRRQVRGCLTPGLAIAILYAPVSGDSVASTDFRGPGAAWVR